MNTSPDVLYVENFSGRICYSSLLKMLSFTVYFEIKHKKCQYVYVLHRYVCVKFG